MFIIKKYNFALLACQKISISNKKIVYVIKRATVDLKYHSRNSYQITNLFVLTYYIKFKQV